MDIEIWILVTFVGLGAVLARFPQARAALSVLGGLYLLHLGWQSVKAARNPTPRDDPRARQAGRGLGSDFLAGLMTNLGNPKALIFFGTLLVRFVPAGGGFFAHFVVWSVMTAMACAWFGLLSLAASRKKLQGLLSSKLHLVNFATGVIFIALGAVMVYEGARGASSIGVAP